jgi:hypothetical protein
MPESVSRRSSPVAISAIYATSRGVRRSQFPSESWFPSIVEKIEASRNVVAHMNPVRKRDIDRIRLNFEDWLEQVKGRQPPSVP